MDFAIVRLAEYAPCTATVTGTPGTSMTVEFISYEDDVQRRQNLNGEIAADGTLKFVADDGDGLNQQSAGETKTPTITAKKTIKKTVKGAALRKKAKSFKIGATADSGGAITFAKVSGSKKITVRSNGRVKVAKKTRKGTYKVKVRITVQANGAYTAGTKTVTLKVKVK